MKKAVKETTPAKIIPAKEVITYIVCCDICDKPIVRRPHTISACRLCNRDICEEHARYQYDDITDYRISYCIFCDKLLFDKYKKCLENLEEKYSKDRSTIIERIKAESLVLGKK